MAFEVQDSDTPTSTANAYVAVAAFKLYADDRGYDYSAKSDTQIEQAIVRATGAMDARWNYLGHKLDADQSTECPRQSAYDKRGFLIEGLPPNLVNACSEYTNIDLLLGLSLLPNSRDNLVEGRLTYLRTKADVVEREQHFNFNKGYQWPVWPMADQILINSELVDTVVRRTVARA